MVARACRPYAAPIEFTPAAGLVRESARTVWKGKNSAPKYVSAARGLVPKPPPPAIDWKRSKGISLPHTARRAGMNQAIYPRVRRICSSPRLGKGLQEAARIGTIVWP